MARQTHKELSFEVPEAWEDRTIVAFTAPARSGSPAQPNVVITKDRLRKGQDLRSHVNRQIAELAKALPAFDLEESRDTLVGGVPAVDLRYTWKAQSGALVQRQVLTLFRDTVYNVTLSAPAALAEEMVGTFDRVVASLALPGSGILRSVSA